MDNPNNKSNGKRILVVDDNHIILQSLSIMLRRAGYLVDTARDGAGTLAVLSQHRPDLILLDIFFNPDASDVGMGLQDGFQILEWLRRMGGAGNIPVIIISSAAPDELKERAHTAGVVTTLQKPLKKNELLDFIANALHQNAAPAPDQPNPAG